MSVGLPADRLQVDSWSGTLARDIDIWTDRVNSMAEWLQAQTEEVLTAPPFNYTTDDVALLKSAVIDLKKLADIRVGELALPEAYDFRTFANRLIGIGIA